MTLNISLSDEQAMALEAKAASEGLSVEQWIQKLADQEQPENKQALQRENRTGADLIAALQASPHRDVDIEPERYRFPARDVRL